MSFAGAEQRIYMSAMLGLSGELQRAFGTARITAVSARSEDQSFGRRFFLMPQAFRERPDEVIAAAIERAGRAVILAPSNSEVDAAAARLVPSGVTIVRPDEVEHNFAPFVDLEQAVLLLANRYDGIDLPDDACRLLVLSGLPAHAHAQERFLLEALGAGRVLSERVRTRIQQGAGRATRNARDFAAVLVRGDALTDFISRDEEMRSLPHSSRQKSSLVLRTLTGLMMS
jgi:RAD3-like DEAD/DEAH box helicase